MKPNNPLPCFRKTLVLDADEYKMMHKVLASVLVAYGKEMSYSDAQIIHNIVDQLVSEPHSQNN